MSSDSRHPHAIRPAQLPVTPASSARSRGRWLVNRLQAMEAAELAYRARSVAAVQLEVLERRTRGRWAWPRPRALAPAPGPPRVLSRERAKLCHSLLGGRIDPFCRAAQQFAQGDFQFMGYPPVTLARPLAYATDPLTGRAWPGRHGLTLDYRSTDVGDPKWTWELNRLQHVPALLAAALLTDDDRPADVAIGDLRAWLAQAQIGQGIAWSNAYEPALRAISLALSLDALRDSRFGDPSIRQDVLRCLDQHVRWIRRYPSLYSSANNHRVGELAAIIAVLALAPELGMGPARTRALAELGRRCEEQFAPDGSHREQAFGYAVFTTELLLMVAGVLRSAGSPVPGWLTEVLRRTEGALVAQLGTEDPDPRYGDCDDGGPTLLGIPFGRCGRSLLAGLRWWAGGEAGEDLDLSSVWLLGARAAPRRPSAPAPTSTPTAFTPAPSSRAATTPAATTPAPTTPAPTTPAPVTPALASAAADSAWLPDAGLAVLRAGQTTLTFDVGPLGFGRLAAHGHADALQVTLAHAGCFAIGDPGTGSYFGNSGVRDAFRGTGYHATVTVDAADQAQSAGPFLWATAPQVRVLELDLQRRVAVGEHDGYARLGVSHRRAVAVASDSLVVIHDTLSSAGRHDYSLRWPLPPGSRAQLLTGGRIRATAAHTALLVATACSAACAPSIVLGSCDPLEGWWSEGLESVTPAPLCRCDISAAGTIEVVSVLAVARSASALSDLELDVDWTERTCHIGGADSWRVQLAGPGSALRYSQAEPVPGGMR